MTSIAAISQLDLQQAIGLSSYSDSTAFQPLRLNLLSWKGQKYSREV